MAITDGILDKLDNIKGSGFSGATDSLEELRDAVDGIGGGSGSRILIAGVCDVGMSGSTTTIVSDDLTGYTDDYFNTKFNMTVALNVNSVGSAPETEVKAITDYVSSTGTFTTEAFTANVEAGDKILIMHESLTATF